MRLDKALVQRGLVNTRAKAQDAINAGRVKVNGTVIDKNSYMLTDDAKIELAQEALSLRLVPDLSFMMY